MSEAEHAIEANFMGAACCAMMFVLDNFDLYEQWLDGKLGPRDYWTREGARREIAEAISVLDARYVMEVERL